MANDHPPVIVAADPAALVQRGRVGDKGNIADDRKPDV
jgi:hypothetical protein